MPEPGPAVSLREFGTGDGPLRERLLAGSGANRVEADTDTGNLPEQRALERAGFTRDGLIRGAQWRRGQWHDRVLYSLLRADCQLPRAAR